jgi:hypothetical protein
VRGNSFSRRLTVSDIHKHLLRVLRYVIILPLMLFSALCFLAEDALGDFLYFMEGRGLCRADGNLINKAVTFVTCGPVVFTLNVLNGDAFYRIEKTFRDIDTFIQRRAR